MRGQSRLAHSLLQATAEEKKSALLCFHHLTRSGVHRDRKSPQDTPGMSSKYREMVKTQERRRLVLPRGEVRDRRQGGKTKELLKVQRRRLSIFR